jgi:hypothetical protein
MLAAALILVVRPLLAWAHEAISNQLVVPQTWFEIASCAQARSGRTTRIRAAASIRPVPWSRHRVFAWFYLRPVRKPLAVLFVTALTAGSVEASLYLLRDRCGARASRGTCGLP